MGELRESFTLDHRASGPVMTVFIVCSLCSRALMSSLGDRHGSRPVYLGCVGLFALGSALVAWAPSFWVLCALRSLALDEAPVAFRGSAQDLVSILTSIGILLAATILGAAADVSEGGTRGMGIAYESAALLLAGVMFALLGLKPSGLPRAAAEAT